MPGVGMVVVLPGSTYGLNPFGNLQTWTQDSPGIPGEPGSYGLFGQALAIGDFDRTAGVYLPTVLWRNY